MNAFEARRCHQDPDCCHALSGHRRCLAVLSGIQRRCEAIAWYGQRREKEVPVPFGCGACLRVAPLGMHPRSPRPADTRAEIRSQRASLPDERRSIDPAGKRYAFFRAGVGGWIDLPGPATTGLVPTASSRAIPTVSRKEEDERETH